MRLALALVTLVLCAPCTAHAAAKPWAAKVWSTATHPNEARVKRDLALASWMFFEAPTKVRVVRWTRHRYDVRWTSRSRDQGRTRNVLTWRVNGGVYATAGTLTTPDWLPSLTVGEGAPTSAGWRHNPSYTTS